MDPFSWRTFSPARGAKSAYAPGIFGLKGMAKCGLPACFQGFSAFLAAGTPVATPSTYSNMNTVDLAELESTETRETKVIHLPRGLMGFEHIDQYELIEDPAEAPFRWLQAVNDPSFAFLVLSPFEVLPDYQPDIDPQDAEYLELTSPLDALILNIVTLRSNGRATINLKGPVIVNRYSLRGKQVVLANGPEYPTRYPLPVAE